MKKFLLLFLLASTIILSGQTSVYCTMPDSSALWSQVHISQSGSVSRYQYKIFNADTLIGAYTYHKLYSRTIPCGDTAMTINNSFLAGGIREDSSKKVYYYSFGPTAVCSGNKSYKIYDFSKQNPGDTILFDTATVFNCYRNPYLTISFIDSILIHGSYKKQYNFVEGEEPWVEGVGSLGGLLIPLNPHTTCLCYDYLTCFLQNDTTYYYNHAHNYCLCGYNMSINNHGENRITEVSPNPFSSETIIKTNKDVLNATFTVYNSFGKQVKNIENISGRTVVLHRDDLPGGVYIIRLIDEGEAPVIKKLVITNN
jgi:hypothetical protein